MSNIALIHRGRKARSASAVHMYCQMSVLVTIAIISLILITLLIQSGPALWLTWHEVESW